MKQANVKELTIGEIVANDFRTSTIFKNAGIDFCCGGKQTLTEACTDKGINQEKLKKDILYLKNEPISQSQNFKEWDTAFLIDYIVNIHHKFVTKNLPELVFYTDKIATVHGGHHPELLEVANLFSQINTELLQHLKNEVEVLFPAIKEVIVSDSPLAKNTIRSEIERMLGEHDFAGSAMDKINELTQNYLIPEDSCNTYTVALKQLEQFEDDIHNHVHLENNILFPNALKLAN